MNKYVSMYLPLVDFIAECMGENTEVVLHDLTDYHQSVVAIRNGNISGRSVGSPITDLSLKVLKAAIFEQVPYMANYQGVAKNGHMLKSSTYFIKDDSERFVGMLCVNTDYHNLVESRNLLTDLIAMLKIPNESSIISENLNMNVQDLVMNNIHRICPDIVNVAETMQQREKMDIVDKLNEMGTFMIKGAISYVADALRVSVPTVYRYLNLVKKEN
ncbi:putative transcriptional regulator YheO [Hydrogenoanaerobacterium saccharovorans]|uniref:Predicted transcriptional regulator YheO, contains PAS and DNA-binding HTH domains n=1 Tax=Hydrogenoanaerobacterium saccharovorans TaxID=474960 RepID=A0A1H7YZK0_9FIRM|nr:PAS domain-containing protein [Hydrogenoanaerobacterium saccharovorans]RPF48907.1 putative transcriptional regulator YheO [Hydrogenoanaerobacterium saccharovorans]SEM51600.1 Predicted transcriptional regulator YheO, contains PAS and DNA-binding HTH domains [Hydrogenoanaerobacterium saccharovorans]